MELHGPGGLVQVDPVGCADFKSITNNSTIECAVNNNTVEVHRHSLLHFKQVLFIIFGTLYCYFAIILADSLGT